VRLLFAPTVDDILAAAVIGRGGRFARLPGPTDPATKAGKGTEVRGMKWLRRYLHCGVAFGLLMLVLPSAWADVWCGSSRSVFCLNGGPDCTESCPSGHQLCIPNLSAWNSRVTVCCSQSTTCAQMQSCMVGYECCVSSCVVCGVTCC